MQAQPGAIGARQLKLYGGAGLGPRGGQEYFHTAPGAGSPRRGGRSTASPLLFEVFQPSLQLSGHARGRHHRGQRHGLLPYALGNRPVGVRSCLTPVRTLAGSLVELVIGLQQGRALHSASKSLGSFTIGDCRPIQPEIHAGSSEGHVLYPGPHARRTARGC